MEISYYKTELVKIDDLIEFQGELKELSNINLEKLWKSMEDSGFSEPFVVWESKKKIYVLGGHQRLKALKAKKNLGENVPDEFPCNFVRCAGKREAKKLLLALASQFGKVTEDGLYSYAIDNDFDADFLKENFELPGLDIELFCDGFFGNHAKIDNQDDGNWDGMPEFEQEKNESYKRIIVHFMNKEAVEKFSKLINQTITENTKFLYYPKLVIEHYGKVKTNEP